MVVRPSTLVRKALQRSRGTVHATALRLAWWGAPSAAAWAAALVTTAAASAVHAAPTSPQAYEVVGDAIPQPLQGLVGDASRGRALVTDRREGLCLLCHRGPFPEERFQGDLSTDLSGAGARWTPGQLRLRLTDAKRLNPDSLMPAYHRSEGLQRVGSAWQGRPLFSAQQVEDVVAFLNTLK